MENNIDIDGRPEAANGDKGGLENDEKMERWYTHQEAVSFSFYYIRCWEFIIAERERRKEKNFLHFPCSRYQFLYCSRLFSNLSRDDLYFGSKAV